jgi:hypothetical protein
MCGRPTGATAHTISGGGTAGIYYGYGQVLARVNVTHWVDSLPDVQVVQRDISGLLQSGSAVIARVEAVLNGDGIDSTNPVTAEFYYNPLAENYSGFLYFPPASSVQNYSVFINVYDEENRFTARSVTVPFNSFAGNITVPSFNASNARPVANAGGNRTAQVASTLELQGSASVGFDGSIVKWEWNIGGQGFVETSSGDTVITLPSSRNSAYTNILRVTDQQGYTATSTMLVNVTNDNPVITGLADTVVGLNALVTFNVSATDSHGISRFLWDFNGDGTFDDTTTTGTNTWTSPGSAGASKVIVAVQDPYDGETRDTATVMHFGSGFHWTPQVSGTSALLFDVTWTGTRFVAVGAEGTILTSSTGNSWASQVSGTQQPLWAVASSGNQVVTIPGGLGEFDTTVLISNDGLQWTGYPIADAAMGARRLIWAGERYVGVSRLGDHPISSLDGINWTRGSVPISFDATFVWTGTQYVATGGWPLRRIVMSPDGESWTSHLVTPPSDAPSIPGPLFTFWIENEFVMIVGSPLMTRLTSIDGLSWVLSASGQLASNQSHMLSMVWTGELLVAVGRNGIVAASPDKGVTWASWKISDEDLHGLVWTGTQFVAVGDNGAILTSP